MAWVEAFFHYVWPALIARFLIIWTVLSVGKPVNSNGLNRASSASISFDDQSTWYAKRLSPKVIYLTQISKKLAIGSLVVNSHSMFLKITPQHPHPPGGKTGGAHETGDAVACRRVIVSEVNSRLVSSPLFRSYFILPWCAIPLVSSAPCDTIFRNCL